MIGTTISHYKILEKLSEGGMGLRKTGTLVAMTFFLFIPVFSQETPERLYQNALYKEEVDGNLTEAIKLYKQVTQKFPKNRPTVAKALFHLASCSERLEDESGAIASYQKILDQFSDQSDIATRAKERLTKLLKEKELRESKAIAVLPFKNMNNDEESEYFSDGFTEDLITQLSKISGLHVISRTSTIPYKKTDKRPTEIGKELVVGNILEGSVHTTGARVRVSAQLIKTTTDEHLWAEKYDKEMAEIFAVQSDVATQVAQVLKVTLLPREKSQLERDPAYNIDAYTYYLKGREYYYRFRKEDNENAIMLFKKALELDSTFALAYAGLGDAYQQRWERFGFSRAWVDSGITVSLKAVSIDSNLADGYKALGLNYAAKGWLRKGLEMERRAVRLNPNHFAAVGNVGFRLYQLGELAEALRWRKKAASLHPTAPVVALAVAESYEILEDDFNADQWTKKALDLEPNSASANLQFAVRYFRQKRNQEALEVCQRILAINPQSNLALSIAGVVLLADRKYSEAKPFFEKRIQVDTTIASGIGLGHVYLKTGREDEAQKPFNRRLKFLQGQFEQGNEHRTVPYDMAHIYALQNNKTEAYHWLQKAVEAGWRDYRWSLVDPNLENLHNDDQFKQMMAQVKEMVDEERRKVEEWEKQEKSKR